MSEVSGWMDGLGVGSAAFAFVAALILGLRHATEPDHLTAVAALVLGGSEAGTRMARSGSSAVTESGLGARRASFLGLSWGMGHAVAFLILGLPVVLLNLKVPARLQAGAEIIIGLLIVFLAARLISRWRRGFYRTLHPEHRGAPGSELGQIAVDRQPFRGLEPIPTMAGRANERYRSPLEAFGIGVVHGVGGSAAAGVFIVAGARDPSDAILALIVFAAVTAISMAAVSGIVGGALTRRSVSSRIERFVPTLGVASAAFGIWYLLAAAAELQ